MEDCSRNRGEGVTVGQDGGAHRNLECYLTFDKKKSSVPCHQIQLTPASFRARKIADPPELRPRAKDAPKYSAIAVSASLTWFWPPWYLKGKLLIHSLHSSWDTAEFYQKIVCFLFFLFAKPEQTSRAEKIWNIINAFFRDWVRCATNCVVHP